MVKNSSTRRQKHSISWMSKMLSKLRRMQLGVQILVLSPCQVTDCEFWEHRWAIQQKGRRLVGHEIIVLGGVSARCIGWEKHQVHYKG